MALAGLARSVPQQGLVPSQVDVFPRQTEQILGAWPAVHGDDERSLKFQSPGCKGREDRPQLIVAVHLHRNLRHLGTYRGWTTIDCLDATGSVKDHPELPPEGTGVVR